jgi:hypothetical protein
VTAGVYGLLRGFGAIGSSSKKPEADLLAPDAVAGFGGRVATLGVWFMGGEAMLAEGAAVADLEKGGGIFGGTDCMLLLLGGGAGALN